MAGMAGYGAKWLGMAGNGMKWDGLITVLGIWGVWDMKIGGLGIGGFPIGSSKTRAGMYKLVESTTKVK